MKIFTTILMMFFATSVFAQSMGPDSLITPAPEQAPQEPEMEFQLYPRNIACQSMGYIRQFLGTRGITQYMVGTKGDDNPDLFDGVIIAMNPVTREYAIILAHMQSNTACLVAFGDSLRYITELE